MEPEERIEKLKSQVQLSQVAAQNTELTSAHLNKIKSIWETQEDLKSQNERNMTIQEVLLDLEVLETTGSTLGHYIKTVKANVNTFSLSEFADKLNAKFLQKGKHNWLKSSERAIPIINRLPGFPLLLGTFKPNAPFVVPEKKRKVTVRQKDVLAAKQKAENVVMTEKNNDSIDVKVNFVIKNLKRCFKENEKQPIPLYDFIIHPTNFTTTVENIFYLSFVIRDGLALIEVFDDELFISPMEREEHETKKISTKKQFIFNITMQQWIDKIKEKNIQEPAIDWGLNQYTPKNV
ncbi:non-structural maintenance of chromosomes element 4 homolog A-like [Planococcus citri]|uniref:non-structural maintenance of chromosomes element 4 homolog A-like n=1 Tax=Planococcus citri TaxID=170843 RepID=UPI0031F78123